MWKVSAQQRGGETVRDSENPFKEDWTLAGTLFLRMVQVLTFALALWDLALVYHYCQ